MQCVIIVRYREPTRNDDQVIGRNYLAKAGLSPMRCQNGVNAGESDWIAKTNRLTEFLVRASKICSFSMHTVREYKVLPMVFRRSVGAQTEWTFLPPPVDASIFHANSQTATATADITSHVVRKCHTAPRPCIAERPGAGESRYSQR